MGIENVDKWTELRTASRVAKLGTVSAAAEALGLHRATVNRHIDILEAEFGARIFIRHARGYALTEVGQDVLRVAQKTEDLIDDLAGRVQGGKARIEGEVKLTILSPFAPLIMIAIAEFRQGNPQCRVEIDTGEGLAKLEYAEAHIALRAGARPDHPDYVVGDFGKIGFNLYAHDNYIAQHGLLTDLRRIKDHRFVLPQMAEGRLPFAPWIGEHIQPAMVALSSRDIAVTTEAILAGIGMGFISQHEARLRGNLHAVLPPDPDWSVQCWIVTHMDLHRTEKVQAMLRCLMSGRPVGQGR